MLKKRIKKPCIVLIAAVCISILSSSCIKGSTAEGGRGNKDKIKIGITVYDQYDTFIASILTYMDQIVKDQEKEQELTLRVNTVNAGGNQLTQNDQVDAFIEQDYDVICVNLVDRTVASTIIDKAKKANIPVVFFNREPVEEDMGLWDNIYYIGGNASDSGLMQGVMVSNAYKEAPDSIDKNGDNTIQYVMLEGEPGHQDSLIRTEMSVKTIKDSQISIEKLANGIANWNRGQANTKMKQWIDSYGEEIELVLCNNDDMALGAIDAYKGSNIKEYPLIVGIDGTKQAMDAIKEGSLYGTVFFNAKGHAEAIFDLAYDLALDKAVSDDFIIKDGKYVTVTQSSVTLKNIDEYAE